MINILKNILLQKPAPEDSPRVRRLRWALCILALAVWCLGLGLVSLIFARGRYTMDVVLTYFQNPLLLFLNLLPAFLITGVLFCLFNRAWIAVLGGGAFIIILSFINHIKLILRDDPLLATDIHYISEAANISTGYNLMLNRHMLLTIIVAVLAVLFFAFLVRARFTRTKPRLIGLCCALLLTALCYGTLYRSDALYARTENLSGNMSTWSEADQYVSRGFLYPLFYSTKEMSDGKPAGYNRAETEALYNSYTNADIPEEEKISIIAIQLEAYNDFSKFGVLDFTEDPYAFLHELQAESAYGELVTNIFAGGTIDTERCFVTGSTSLYEYRGNTDSLARYLGSQGYATDFCHTGYEWFYNRQNVAKHMGFDNAWFYENRYNNHNDYGAMNDTHFFPDLITLFEEAKSNGQPWFNLSITYQNHGPYSDTELMYDETYVSKNGLSDGAWTILNNYLAGVAKTGEALRTLVDHFRTEEEPVVILFFGDHNPWLGDGAWVYEELGIDFEGDDGFYNYYCTPWVCWANDAAREIAGDNFVTGDQGNFSPCFLGAELFDLLGWEGSSTINALRDLRTYTDVIHATGVYRENGALFSSLSATPQEKLDQYLDIEYYLRREAVK